MSQDDSLHLRRHVAPPTKTHVVSGVALLPKNHRYVLIRYGSQRCRGEQRAEADRREVDPPIEVETATWSKAGQLDWWVKERENGGVAYAVLTAVNGGSELLIFVRRAAHSHDLSLSIVAGRRASLCPEALLMLPAGTVRPARDAPRRVACRRLREGTSWRCFGLRFGHPFSHGGHGLIPAVRTNPQVRRLYLWRRPSLSHVPCRACGGQVHKSRTAASARLRCW